MYTSVNIATTAANPLIAHTVLQDRMMSVLSRTIITYIVNMISRQVRQQESENDAIFKITKPYLVYVEPVSLPSNFRMSQF